MKENEFLGSLGWPKEAAELDGMLRWSAPNDEMGTTIALLMRKNGEITLSVRDSTLDGETNLMSAQAREVGGEISVSGAEAGDPPEPMMVEDALDMFKFMTRGMGRPVFTNAGPSRKPGM